MDYKLLLEKYMQHVVEEEMWDYVGEAAYSDDFTTEEKAELKRISEKIDGGDKS